MKIETGKTYYLPVVVDDTDEGTALITYLDDKSKWKLHWIKSEALIDPATLQAESYEEGEMVDIYRGGDIYSDSSWMSAIYAAPMHEVKQGNSSLYRGKDNIRKLPKPAMKDHALTGEEWDLVQKHRKGGE